MTRKLILFNGPPRSGKDTAADRLAHSFGAYSFKFSAPIKAAIRAAFGLCDDEVEYAESIKSESTALFHGNSYRETQISFSERWMKPTFGIDVFGHLAARHLRSVIAKDPGKSLYVCSDSGFAEEAEPVVEIFGPGNVLLVHVHRDGCDFAGDSRSFINLGGVYSSSLTNNATLEEYHQAVDGLGRAWLYQCNPF
jgi:hypothetical protein